MQFCTFHLWTVIHVTRNAELKRLEAAQNLTFQHKQAAYQALIAAKKHRAITSGALEQARKEQRLAYNAHDAAWQNYKSVRDSKSAHAEIRDALSKLNLARPVFQNAKAKFADARDNNMAAIANCKQARSEFEQAKTDHERTAAAYRALRDKLAAISRQKKEKQTIARRAGIPQTYIDNVWIVREASGTINLYFGGIGKPNGPSHGHYVMASNGVITYRRDPFSPHGCRNFTYEEAYIARKRDRGYAGGYGRTKFGYIDNRPVTFALGWGTKKGETLLANGHVTAEEFRFRSYHYNKGGEHHNNEKLQEIH